MAATSFTVPCPSCESGVPVKKGMIGKKTDWVKSKGLLGGFVWEMSGDTPDGRLMTALANGLE